MELLREFLKMFSPPITQTRAMFCTVKDVSAIAGSAQRIVGIVNESLKIANESTNSETKLSHLGIARQKFSEVKKLASDCPFLTITSLVDVERDITRLASELELAGYQSVADDNATGENLEKAGQIDEAIFQYERLLKQKVDTPFTYRRLAILYRERQQPHDEVRVILAALKNVSKSNAAHYSWFQERMSKGGWC